MRGLRTSTGHGAGMFSVEIASTCFWQPGSPPLPPHTPGLSGGSPVWGASKHLAILPEGPIQVVLMLDPPTCP